jgi:predicted transposase YbfD/YdcC
MVSTFAAEMRMTLSCLAAKDGDEVSAALELLGLVDLAGKIVTAYALHCHPLPRRQDRANRFMITSWG